MNNNKKTAITILMMVAGMFAFAFAAFPLYSLFCKVTGYGGTPKIATESATELGSRIMKVRFNADTSKDVPWQFKPLQNSVTVRTGENKLIFYTSENTSNEAFTGVATFNVTPDIAAKYFNKIQCFCFNNQTLEPGEKVQMPVSFYIDPAIEQNLDLKGIDTVTLSYTFFKAVD